MFKLHNLSRLSLKLRQSHSEITIIKHTDMFYLDALFEDNKIVLGFLKLGKRKQTVKRRCCSMPFQLRKFCMLAEE